MIFRFNEDERAIDSADEVNCNKVAREQELIFRPDLLRKSTFVGTCILSPINLLSNYEIIKSVPNQFVDR